MQSWPPVRGCAKRTQPCSGSGSSCIAGGLRPILRVAALPAAVRSALAAVSHFSACQNVLVVSASLLSAEHLLLTSGRACGRSGAGTPGTACRPRECQRRHNPAAAWLKRINHLSQHLRSHTMLIQHPFAWIVGALLLSGLQGLQRGAPGCGTWPAPRRAASLCGLRQMAGSVCASRRRGRWQWRCPGPAAAAGAHPGAGR
jgi:hypothetical protein